MRITLVGWNCKKNLGDDVMTDVIIDNLSKKYPDASFKIIGEEKSLPLFQSGLMNPGIGIKGIKNYDFFNALPVLKTLYNRLYIASIIALKSDIIVIGGGTIYHSVSLSKFYRQIAWLKNTFNPGCRIFSIGVSIGPFKNNDETAEFDAFATNVDFFAVRDSRSWDMLKKKDGNVQAPDLALAYPSTKEFNVKKQDSIAIILRQGHVDEKTTAFLKEFIEGLNKRFPEFRIKLFSFCEYHLPSENDTLAIESFIKTAGLHRLPIEIVRYNNVPHEYCGLLAQSKLIVTIRLHGAVLGYMLKVPFFMISYHRKCEDFFNELKLDKRFMINASQSAKQYLEDASAVLTGKLAIEFKDLYSSESLNHFKING